MVIFFGGLGISLAYGIVAFISIWCFEDKNLAQDFAKAYTSSFKTIISLGLILGTALIIHQTQDEIPETIENAFTQLKSTQLKRKDKKEEGYEYYKNRYQNRAMSVRFSSYLILVAFLIFGCCQFPLSTLGEVFMLIAVCAEYAFAVYVGRKLMNIGMMLHSLMNATVPQNLFKERKLDDINTYVNVASTLTIIFVYVHFSAYYNAPFAYDRIGKSAQPFIIFLPLIATPVLLIFNFYPRLVLRKLYSESIDVEIQNLKKKLSDEKLSSFEMRSHIIEFKKISRDELRYNLQLTLTDLPIGITILVLIMDSILKR
jgi:hypothetical protein